MLNLISLLPVINVVVLLATVGGGAWIFLGSRRQMESTIQERVIAAMTAEREGLERRLDALTTENAQMRATISTIRIALKRRGITIRINGDYVTFEDTAVAKEMMVRITKAVIEEQAAKDDEGSH